MACHFDACRKRACWSYIGFVFLANIDFFFADGPLQVGQGMAENKTSNRHLASWDSVCIVFILLYRLLKASTMQDDLNATIHLIKRTKLSFSSKAAQCKISKEWRRALSPFSMLCAQKSQLLRTFRTKRVLGRHNNVFVTLWTGSTVPQQSIFRDLEARGRLRDFVFFVRTNKRPKH